MQSQASQRRRCRREQEFLIARGRKARGHAGLECGQQRADEFSVRTAVLRVGPKQRSGSSRRSKGFEGCPRVLRQTESRVWRKLKTVSSLGKANKLQAQALGELQSASAVRYTPAGAVQLKPWHKNTIGFEKRLC